MATETKLTTKQMSIKIGKILKGVDNSVTQIHKHQTSIGEAIPALQKLVGGITNNITPVAPAKETKPVKEVKKAKPEKPVKEAKKPVKEVKKAKPDKEVKKPAKELKKPAKEVKKPVAERPALKQVIKNVITNNGTPMTSSEIYKTIIDKHGIWSRQSVYNALKDKSLFTRTNDVFSLTVVRTKPDEKAEALVADVAADSDVTKVM